MSDLSYNIDNPNDRNYNNTLIATWNNTTDVNQFLNTYNYSNGYKVSNTNRLSPGNKIKINDGTYNKTWYIAGFDLEHNQIAADGTTYDNGTGILLIPENHVLIGYWDNSSNTSCAYINSDVHTSTLPTIANNLKNVLGTHLINRNVLLSSSVSSSNGSTGYTWTTAYCTLLSTGQITGNFAQHNNKYDDGEANYKLPLFNNLNMKTTNGFWLRGINRYTMPWLIENDGYIGGHDIYPFSDYGVRPLIYIR